MFLMTSNITVGGFKPFKPNAVSWRRSISDYSDSATFKIPAIARLKKIGDGYDSVQTGMIFKEGMTVKIECGYDSNNPVRFQGFIRRIKFSVPLEIECEGYSYQIRKIRGYKKSYKLVTVKQLLSDLIAGTDIKLMDNMPTVELENIGFDNVSGTDVLDYLKDKCLLTTYFIGSTLYCGLMMGVVTTKIKHWLNWNVIKDSDLNFDPNRELATLKIILEKRGKDGVKSKVSDGDETTNTKVLRIFNIKNEADRQRVAQEVRAKLLHKGYEGTLNSFLFPVAEPGMSTFIGDIRYPERTATYFIEKVEGSFNDGGGRQKIQIGALLAT